MLGEMADDRTKAMSLPFLEIAGVRERGVGRAAVTLLLAAAAGFAAATVAAALVLAIAAAILAAGGLGVEAAFGQLADSGRPGRTLIGYTYELAMVGSVSLAAVWAFIAVVARRAGRPIRTFLTAAAKFRWRHALVGLAVYLPLVAVEIGLEQLARPSGDVAPLAFPGASATDRLIYAAAALGFLWCAALAEEILFRGWLMQQARAFTRNVVVILAVSGVAFSLAHGDPTPGGLLTRLALGVGWAWIALRLGGIEFTAGAHLANNLGIALLAQPVLLSAAQREPFNALSVALQVGTTAALVLGVEWWVRRKGGQPIDPSDCAGASSPRRVGT